jgi:MinD-like ATPase involved in chromosome partitioning or flagellar assembly
VKTPTKPDERELTRERVYADPMVDGRPVRDTPVRRLLDGARLRFMGELQRRERLLDARLGAHPGVARVNTIAVVSPKGGVGKTTMTFVLGELLAARLKLRVIAIDANPDFGTLATLAPDRQRSDRTLVDLLADHARLGTAAELRSYVSRTSTGLHVLGAPADAELMTGVTRQVYDDLWAFLSRFYEVILLDLGTGITDPIARFGAERADQLVVVSTPEYVTAANVLRAVKYLDHGSKQLVLNQAHARSAVDQAALDRAFAGEGLAPAIAVPYDARLRAMIDSGTYRLEALPRSTRVPVKQLGVHVADALI